MKCKHLRLIMELIFIFILPFVVLLMNVSIDNQYVYDNNGNFESAEKTLHYSGLTFTTDVFNSEVEPIYIVINEPVVVGSTLIYTDFIEFNSLNRALYYTGEYTLSLLYYDDNLNLINSGALNPSNTITNTSYKYFRIGRGVNAGVVSPALLRNKVYYNSSDNFIVESPFVHLKNLLCNVLKVDNTNSIVNIVFDYTCLWLIMFLVWHFVYRLFDWIVHLIDKKGD